MEKIIVLGAGAHAGSIIDLIRHEQKLFEVVGIVDPVATGKVHGVPVIGDDSILAEVRRSGIRYAFPGIGFGEHTNNKLRKKVFLVLKETGFKIPSLVSSGAFVRQQVRIDEGVLVQAGCVIDSRATLGDNVLLGFNVLIGHDCVVEAHATLSGGVILNGGVKVGEGVFMGMGSILYRDVGEWAKISPGVACLNQVPDNSIVFGENVRVIPNFQSLNPR